MAFRGFGLNQRNERGNTALHMALVEPSITSVKWLIRQAGVDLNARNGVGETALMQAIIHGHREIALLLLEAGAEVNQTGWTPLHYAAASHTDAAPGFVWLLLDKYSAYIDAESPNGTTPLMMAARYGKTESVQILLEAGADLNTTNQQGLNAWGFAQGSEHPDTIKLLQRVLAQRNAERPASLGKTQQTQPVSKTQSGPPPPQSNGKPTVFESVPKGRW